MEILLGITIVVLVVGFVGTFLFLKNQQKEKAPDQAMLMLQNQLNEMARLLDVKMGESTQAMQRQFGQSAQIIRDVTEKLVRLEETNKQVMSRSEQLKNLQDILKNPKQRGILGEYYLETVLKN